MQLNGNLRDKDNLSTKDKCLTPSASVVRCLQACMKAIRLKHEGPEEYLAMHAIATL